MSVRLYGVLDEPVPDSALPDGVRALATPAGVAWVRTVDGPVDATTVDADEQRRVLLVALGSGRTPAPARPGTHFPDDAALVDALTRSADTWRAVLARVQGAVEMLVFVPEELGSESNSGESTLTPITAAGRAYLERLRSRLAPADRWRDALREALGDCVREDAVVAHPSGRGVLVSHLVARAELPTYRARLDAWRRAPDAPRCAVFGPWPPFSFASDVSR